VKTRSIAFSVAAIVVAVVAGACAGLPSLDEPGGDPTAEPSATTKVPRPQASGESLEGKFGYETMDGYVDAIIPMITEYMDKTWQGRMPRPKVIFVPRGAAGPEGCLDGSGRAASYSRNSFEYCGADRTVYLGQDMLFDFYDRTGDAGPAVGIAHEFGHHIQQQMGVPSPRTAEQSIRHENQADCIAGAWTKFTDDQNWLEYPDDIEDIDALFPLIGSAEGPDRDHGTTGQRQASFQRGFEGGIFTCSSFYPAAPLV